MEYGADPNAKGQHDVTPLMMAAAAPRPDPALVSLLMEKGADKSARDQAGRTALDWASLQGDTPVARLLRDAGTPTTPIPSPPAAVAQPRTTRAAIEGLSDGWGPSALFCTRRESASRATTSPFR